MNITWDTMEGGRVEAGAGVLDVTRSALVTDIPAAEQSDPFVLLRALEKAVATAGQAAPGTGGRALLTSMVVSPAKGTDQARIVATYTAPQANPNGGAVRWVISDASTLSSDQTELDPFNEPLHADYTPPATAAGGGGGGLARFMSPGPPQAMPYPFASNVLRPRRVISLEGYLIGRPSSVVLNALGCVNMKPWPTSSLFRNDPPKRRGCWLCSSVEASADRPGLIPNLSDKQLYRVSVRFTSRGKYPDKGGKLAGDRDWSDYGVFKNILGRIPDDVTAAGNVAKMLALMKREYKVGQIRADDDGGVNGYCKVGNYPVYDFKAAVNL